MGKARDLSNLLNNSGKVESTKIVDDLSLQGTSALTVVRGTTAQRPASAEGLLRFNTTKKTIEGVLSTQWSRDWHAMTMAPAFYGFNSIDTSGVSGWKTLRVTPDFNSGLAGASVYNSSTGRFQPNEEGWYFLPMGHGHINGTHGAYRCRIFHNVFGSIGYQWIPTSDTMTIAAFSYFNGSTHYAEFQTYHDNNSHPDNNFDRAVYQSAFRIIGADNS